MVYADFSFLTLASHISFMEYYNMGQRYYFCIHKFICLKRLVPFQKWSSSMPHAHTHTHTHTHTSPGSNMKKACSQLYELNRDLILGYTICSNNHMELLECLRIVNQAIQKTENLSGLWNAVSLCLSVCLSVCLSPPPLSLSPSYHRNSLWSADRSLVKLT